MITLNLIPPHKKKELLLTQLYIGIKNLIILVLFISTIIATILLVTKIILQNYFTKIVEDTTLITKYASTFNQDLQQFNKEVEALAKVQNDHVNWLIFLAEISSTIPADITLNHVGIIKNKVLLNGTAKTRNALLEFRDALTQLSILTDVNLPLEYQLKRENIEFSIEAGLEIKSLQPYVN